MVFSFSLPVECKSCPRPRHGRHGSYMPSDYTKWKRSTAALIRSGWKLDPLDQPLTLSVDMVFARPKRLQRKKDPDGRLPRCSKADTDNYLKSVMDAIETAGVVRNDSLFWNVSARQWYGRKDENPNITISISTGAQHG